jgi:hypothetical protein
MLTRQWQFGELQGDDAGSPIHAALGLTTSRLTAFAARDSALSAYAASPPLETRVEREVIVPDLRLRIDIGMHWLRLLRERLGNDKYRALFVQAYPISVPPGDAAHALEFSHREAMAWRHAARGRVPDGGTLMQDLQSGKDAGEITAGGLAVSPVEKNPVRDAAADLLAWYSALFSHPESPDDDAWEAARLEYRFRCTAPEPGGGATELRADSYHEGHLDWYSVDARPIDAAGAGPLISDPSAVTSSTIEFLPAPVQFGGMPNVRWWEFEDRRTDFGRVEAHTTDLATLLLLEFALAYGNDWSVIPCTVPAGSYSRVDSLIITDVFGQRTLVPPAGQSANTSWHRWSLFGLSRSDGSSDSRLLVLPTVHSALEGRAIETVVLVRDEMANMVWAVESTIPDELGGGRKGFEASLELRQFFESIAPPAPPPAIVDTGASIAYRLASTVPENWIPLIPVHVPGSNREIQLQRAAMPRTIAGLPSVPIPPRGRILVPQPVDVAPYFIAEEEVPRAGIVVSRSFQRTRAVDGTIFLWVGRSKGTGRGEGSSGLAFDWIEPR